MDKHQTKESLGYCEKKVYDQ